MPRHRIRFATLADLPVVRTLWMAMIREVPQAYPSGMTSAATADDFTRQASAVLSDPNPVTFCLLAEVDGVAIGMHIFGFQRRDLGQPSVVVFCYSIYVHPDHRRTDVAEDLALVGAEYAVAQGVTHCEMTRVPGQALRRGLGFTPFEIHSQAPLATIIAQIDRRRARRSKLTLLQTRKQAMQ
jgi:GNAT superfamily N-acetyltransferase